MDKEIEEKIIDMQGQIDELNKKLQEKPKEISVPRAKVFEDVKRYPILKVDKLYCGLPIYDTSTTTNHLQGEIYLTKIGTTTTFHAFVDGTEVDL